MNFAHLLRKSARMYSARPAIIMYGGETVTYAELFERACRFANGLEDLGVKRGDRVALLLDNCAEVLEAISGLALGGYVRCPLYTHNTPETNQYLLELTDTRMLILHRRYYETHADLFDDLPDLEFLVVVDDVPDGAVSYGELVGSASSADPNVELMPDDLHQIRFSAGTTGRPKGIAHTNAGWYAMGNEYALGIPRIYEDDRFLAAGPLTFVASVLFWPCVASGAATVVLKQFEPELALRAIEEERCSYTIMVPTMIRMVADHPNAETTDFSSMRVVLYGGEPISEPTLRAGLARWGNIMHQGYGQSEANPLAILSAAHHRPDGTERERAWMRSAGRPFPNVIASVIDDDGNDLPAGEIGEIAVLAPGRMHSIWKDPEQTRARILPDGRVRTRDIGYIDDDGFIYLTSRKEDMIISGGINIWPAEIEKVLHEHPAVHSAAVAGVPHPRWGETPVTAVVLKDGHAVTEEEIINWTREHAGSVKKVTSVRFVDRLPTSGVGKVLRSQIRVWWDENGNEKAEES